jgi:hypothetical protein
VNPAFQVIVTKVKQDISLDLVPKLTAGRLPKVACALLENLDPVRFLDIGTCKILLTGEFKDLCLEGVYGLQATFWVRLVRRLSPERDSYPGSKDWPNILLALLEAVFEVSSLGDSRPYLEPLLALHTLLSLTSRQAFPT